MKFPDTYNRTKTMKGKKEIAAKQSQLKGKTWKNKAADAEPPQTIPKLQHSRPKKLEKIKISGH